MDLVRKLRRIGKGKIVKPQASTRRTGNEIPAVRVEWTPEEAYEMAIFIAQNRLSQECPDRLGGPERRGQELVGLGGPYSTSCKQAAYRAKGQREQQELMERYNIKVC